jgi:acyl-coenzyme A thioesterase PaaI-like protein
MLLKASSQVWLLGLKIPQLLFLLPRVEALDEAGCTVRIPFGWRSRNHVGSMYLGALCAGADLAAALPGATLIWSERLKVVPVFADLKAEFLKRADGDVLFRNDGGQAVVEAVRRADASGERVTLPVSVTCTVPSRYGDEPVARFTMGLSLKRRGEPEVRRPPAPG